MTTASPFSLAREAAWETADGHTRPGDATDATRHARIDQDSTAAMSSFSAWIAVVDVADDTTTNHRAEDRAEDSANTRTTAAHASIVTTRRRTARIRYRDRLRPWRHRSRIIRDRRLSDRLRLGLSNGRRRLGLNDLRRRLRSWLVVSYAIGWSLLLGRRSCLLDRRDYLLTRVRGAVGKRDPVGRGGKLFLRSSSIDVFLSLLQAAKRTAPAPASNR